MDFNNRTELEQYFAKNFDTILFPVLADNYLNDGDLHRARKVCEIGMEYHPNHVEGLFVLANIASKEGNLQDAEQHLSSLISQEPQHYRGAVLLALVQESLRRASQTIDNNWRRVIRINPLDKDAQNYFKESFKTAKSTQPEKIFQPTDTAEVEKNNEPEVTQKQKEVPRRIVPEESNEALKLAQSSSKLNVPKPEVSSEQRKIILPKVEPKPIETTEQEIKKEYKVISNPNPVVTVKPEVKVEQKEVTKPRIVPEPKKIIDPPKLKIEKPEVLSEKILSPKPPTLVPQPIKESDVKSLNVSKRMATFTMVNILKKQKLYKQALEVLKSLKEKGADETLVAQEEQEIKKLIKTEETG